MEDLQTLMVLRCALSLGPKLGMARMGLYPLAGVGVPLFAEGCWPRCACRVSPDGSGEPAA